MSADVQSRASDTIVGTVVAGRYRVIEAIARGGMGRIYKAEQLELGRLVALKVLDDANEDPEGFRRRFTLEAATCARLSHPNIVVVHDYGSFEVGTARRYFMAMELIEGRTLAAVMALDGRLPAGRAAWIAREIARALREAHRQGVIHRDLKPGNVMLNDRADGEHVKVLDFGIAKVRKNDGAEPITGEGAFVGTPRYMSPEQLSAREIDARSDLFSVGVLLYQMLSARVPHADKDIVQAMLAHVTEPTPELPDDVVDVPEGLREIIRKCMRYEPEHRYADAASLLAALDEVASGLPGWSRTTVTTTTDVSVTITERGRRVIGEDAPTASGPRLRSSLGASTAIPSKPEMSAPQVAPRSRRRFAWAVLSIGAIAIAVIVVQARPATPSISAPPPPTIAATPPPTTPPTTPPEPTTFTLRIESTPAGAHVLLGETEIGLTPTSIALPRDVTSVLSVVHDGFAPYVLSQPPSQGDVTVHAALVPAHVVHRPHVRPPVDHASPPEDRLLKTSR